MKFPYKYIIAITLALVALALVAKWLQGEMLSFLLLVGALAFILTYLSQVNGQIRKLVSRFFQEDNKKNPIEAVQSTTALLEAQESQLKSITVAIEKIQEGNMEGIAALQLEGEAGTAIQNLQNKLREMKEAEAKQSWSVKGVAQMGEIRKSNSSLNDYAYEVISTLVKYTEANQGAFYLLADDQEQSLELLASYAYGKRKYTDGKVTVDISSGLLGQSVMEKDIIFLRQVPKDYVKITSGLGEATPRCITIAPLIFREQVYGVMEMASFRVLEKYHLDFIKKVSEGIAAELADVLRQEKTTRLLEQSQQQTNELRSQEEELRQNMEEMQAIQEEMKRKEKELVRHMGELNIAQDQMKQKEAELMKQLKQVLSERKKNQAILEGCVDGVISFDEQGIVQFFNHAAEEILGFKKMEIMNRPVAKILNLNIVENPYNKEDKKLLTTTGNEINIRTEVNIKDKSGNEISLLLTATKVKLEEGTLFTLFAQKISVDLF